MDKLNVYATKLLNFFETNKNLIQAIAQNCLSKYYSLPIDLDDLICFTFHEFSSVEMETIYYSFKGKISFDKFILSRIKIVMFKICNLYIWKNHKIMNNYISFDEKIDQSTTFCGPNYYVEEDNELKFLQPFEFKILYDLYVNKFSHKEVAKKYGLVLWRTKVLEGKIIRNIKKHHGLY